MSRILLLVLSFVLAVGCQTTPKKAAYTTLSAIATSVDLSMRAYYDYRDSPLTNVTKRQDEQVKSLYLKYQHAMSLAEKTYKVGQVPVASEVSTLSLDIINFINTLTNHDIP